MVRPVVEGSIAWMRPSKFGTLSAHRATRDVCTSQVQLANLQQVALARLEPVLRGVILKLQYADSCLAPLPMGEIVYERCFTIFAGTRLQNHLA